MSLLSQGCENIKEKKRKNANKPSGNAPYNHFRVLSSLSDLHDHLHNERRQQQQQHLVKAAEWWQLMLYPKKKNVYELLCTWETLERETPSIRQGCQSGAEWRKRGDPFKKGQPWTAVNAATLRQTSERAMSFLVVVVVGRSSLERLLVMKFEVMWWCTQHKHYSTKQYRNIRLVIAVFVYFPNLEN